MKIFLSDSNFCLFNKEKDEAMKDAGDSDILRKARIYNKNSGRALKPYEEAVNAAAGTLALNDPTLLARRGTQNSFHQCSWFNVEKSV